MKTVSDYVAQWDLRLLQEIEQTKMCTVYKVCRTDGTLCALKVMNEIGVRFESDSYQWYEFMDGHGAARLYAHDVNAMLMEYLDGGELSDLVFNGHDHSANDIALQVIASLHDGQDASRYPEFKSLEEHYHCLFHTGMEHPLLISAQNMTRDLLDTQAPEDIRVLHADMHHKNIMGCGRGWLAIDPQNVIGDRHYDVANLFKNPDRYDGVFEIARIEKLEEQACAVLNLRIERVRRFAFTHMMLAACWHVLDGEDPGWPLRMVDILYPRIKK